MPHLPRLVNNNSEKTSTSPQKLGYLTVIVMAMTVISRLFGFLRDIIFAQIFGATAEFDAFVIAFKIPNFMRRLFGEGAFSQAFIPVLVEYRTKYGAQGVRSLINNMTGLLSVILLAAVLIGEIGAPLLVLVFAPGFAQDAERYRLATHLIRITLPYLLAIGLVALAGAILNTYNRFALTAFTPVLLNLMLIAATLWWVPHVPAVQAVAVLAWAVALCGLVQLVLQWPVLHQLGLLPKPTWHWRDEGVRRVFKQMLPALLGVSVAQISLLIDNLFASFLPAGSISWLYYSDRLLYFPLGVIGVALSTVVMPHLSHHHHQGEREHFAATLDWALRCLFVTAIPAAIGLMLLAGPILATLMHHGAFTAHDVEMTRRSLIAFTSGLPALMAIKIFASAFYAQHDIRTPARIAGLAILLNLVANIVLIFPLAHAGLALATALASWLNAVLLWIFLQRRQIFQASSGWLRISAGVVIGSLLMAAVLWWGAGSGRLLPWLSGHIVHNSGRLFILLLAGAGVYLAGLWIAGLRWQHFKY